MKTLDLVMRTQDTSIRQTAALSLRRSIVASQLEHGFARIPVHMTREQNGTADLAAYELILR